jgi:integrase/recombinase XerD
VTAAATMPPGTVWDVTEEGERYMISPMTTPAKAVDLYIGDCSRRGLAPRTISTYERLLWQFCDRVPNDQDVSRITTDDCARFLDGFNGQKKRGEGQYARGTSAHTFTVLKGFFVWLYRTDRIKRNPIDRLEAPRRIPSEDLDVVTVSTDDVRKLLDAGRTWAERLAVAIPAYLGPRRRAVALLTLNDYDRERKRLRFNEKGGKVIWKPVPVELEKRLEAALAARAFDTPDGRFYLVPPEGPLVRPDDRDDRVIWRLVSKVADRAGVRAHVHALRAAFAVFYLEAGGDKDSLQDLMGHRSPATTQVYLRKLNRETRMEHVRTLSWALPAETHADSETDANSANLVGGSSLVGAGGFEPPKGESRGGKRSHSQPQENRL